MSEQSRSGEFDIINFYNKLKTNTKFLLLILIFLGLVLNIIFVIIPLFQKKTSILVTNILPYDISRQTVPLTGKFHEVKSVHTEYNKEGVLFEVIHTSINDKKLDQLIQHILLNSLSANIKKIAMNNKFTDAKKVIALDSSIDVLEKYLDEMKTDPFQYGGLQQEKNMDIAQTYDMDNTDTLNQKFLTYLAYMSKKDALAFLENYIRLLKYQVDLLNKQNTQIDGFLSEWRKVSLDHITNVADLSGLQISNQVTWFPNILKQYQNAGTSYSITSEKLLNMKEAIKREFLIIIFSLIFSVTIVILKELLKDLKIKIENSKD